MIARIASFVLAVAGAVAWHLMHQYVMCGIFTVIAIMHLITTVAVMANPKIFD